MPAHPPRQHKHLPHPNAQITPSPATQTPHILCLRHPKTTKGRGQSPSPPFAPPVFTEFFGPSGRQLSRIAGRSSVSTLRPWQRRRRTAPTTTANEKNPNSNKFQGTAPCQNAPHCRLPPERRYKTAKWCARPLGSNLLTVPVKPKRHIKKGGSRSPPSQPHLVWLNGARRSPTTTTARHHATPARSAQPAMPANTIWAAPSAAEPESPHAVPASKESADFSLSIGSSHTPTPRFKTPHGFRQKAEVLSCLI